MTDLVEAKESSIVVAEPLIVSWRKCYLLGLANTEKSCIPVSEGMTLCQEYALFSF